MRLRIVVLLVVTLLVGALGTATGVAASSARQRVAGCGQPATAGVTTQQLTVDGTTREYLLSIPDTYDATTPAPLLFNFHGLASNMQEQSIYTQLDAQAGSRGYVVITPNGQDAGVRYWSVTPATSANPDVAFVEAMLSTTNRTLCIDQRRIYSAGMSNGAIFSTLLVCALPGRLAAIAPVAGVNVTKPCARTVPKVNIVAFHGTADPIVPYRGGALFGGAGAFELQATPVDQAIAAWAKFDGCAPRPRSSAIGDDVVHLVWRDCPTNGVVQLYRVVDGGHTWPGAISVRPDQLGATTTSISATKVLLDFFDRHPRKG